MKKILTAVCAFLMLMNFAIAADLSITADRQSFSETDSKAKFEGNVTVKVDDMIIKGKRADAVVNPRTNKLEHATFYDKPYAYQVKNNKRNEVKANILKLSLIDKILTAEGATQTIVTEDKVPTIVITADSQEYNTQTNILTAKGAVVVNYKDAQSFSDRGVATITKQGDIKRLQLFGNAKIVSKESIIEGNTIDYDAVTENAIATGNVHTDVTMNEDRIVVDSNYQQYNKRDGIMIASNNVRVKYKDYFAQGPKASVFADKKTKKWNEVIFLGRSKITEKARTIEADRIKMILNPKSFFADGNVQTFIPNVGSVDGQ